MKDYRKMLADVLFPPICPVCRDVIPMGKRASFYEGKPEYTSFVCEPCLKKFRFIEGNICEVCGAEAETGKTLCHVCEKALRSFAGGRSVFDYNGAARAMMMSFKYNGKAEFADFLCHAAVKRHGDWIRSLKPDAIVPVPIHPEKLKERGYNQAELLAKGIASATGVPMRDILMRRKETGASKELGQKSRVLNLKDAFALKGQIPAGKRFLLVDDILTTGVTLESCTALLLEEGKAEAVYVLSLCSGK